MRAALGNASLIHYNDLVCIAHGFEPMGNHNNGLVSRQLFHRMLNQLFIFRINVGGRFIQNNNRRILNHRARNGNALLFAAGQRRTVLSDDRVVLIRQLHDKIMAARTLCRVNHFLVRRIRLSKANVIGNRVVEQIDVLEHNTDVFQHLIGIILTNILAADGNRTAVHIPESANQIAQGSFAAAGISDNRRRGLLRNGQRYMVNHIFLLIGETNIVHCNIAGFSGERLAAVFQLRRISALLNFTQCRVYILQNCNHAACQLELVEDDKQPNDCQSRFFDSNLSIETHHHRRIHRQHRAALQNNL